MGNLETQVHGGNLDEASRTYGIPRDQWLDLSTGINPVAYPVTGVEAHHWQRLPEAGDLEDLISAARACYGAPDSAALVPAPGTQSLIQLLPRLRTESRVAVAGPTYTEHAHCWRLAGHSVEEFDHGSDWPADADVTIVVQPNNPDGATYPPAELRARAREAAARGGHLVVDEAFADVVPEFSVAGETGAEGLVVLRSFGKFFGLAGLRLGFALTDGPTGDQIRQSLGPWSVAGPALEIGRRALSDVTWINETRRRLAADAGRLDSIMEKAGLDRLGGTPLYGLYRAAGGDIHVHLAQQGIWTRAFPGRPGVIRLGLPGDNQAFQRLADALA